MSNSNHTKLIKLFIYDAIQKHQVGKIRSLLSENPPVWRVNDYLGNKTALINATEARAVNIVECLIDHGADVNMKEKGIKNTALMLASADGYLEIVKLLVNQGKAKLNLRNIDGGTALICASEAGHLDIVRFLVDSGADITAQIESGETALDFAQGNNHQEIVEYLTTKIEESNKPKSSARGGYRKKTCKRRNCRRKQTRRK